MYATTTEEVNFDKFDASVELFFVKSAICLEHIYVKIEKFVETRFVTKVWNSLFIKFEKRV